MYCKQTNIKIHGSQAVYCNLYVLNNHCSPPYDWANLVPQSCQVGPLLSQPYISDKKQLTSRVRSDKKFSLVGCSKYNCCIYSWDDLIVLIHKRKAGVIKMTLDLLEKKDEVFYDLVDVAGDAGSSSGFRRRA